MKFNISNMTVALAAAALGAASCTANYEDINRNPYEVTAEDMERDGYAMRSFMTTMQSWVIPADVNQCQFTDLLLGGPYGGYIADANSGFNTGKFSTYDPQSNWSPVFYRVIYTNEMSNFTELCKVTEDENAIAVAKVVKVAGSTRSRRHLRTDSLYAGGYGRRIRCRWTRRKRSSRPCSLIWMLPSRCLRATVQA